MNTVSVLILCVSLPVISPFLFDQPNKVFFKEREYEAAVVEYANTGTVITRVSAVSNSSQPIVYKLLDNTNDFVIDRNNGLIKTQRPLDRETMSSYRLTVIATFNSSDDELSKTLVHVQVLDVNDNAPVFERKSYTFLIKSDAPVGTEVGRVRATDADMGLNGQISYSLHFPGQDPFTVDRNDGTITLTRRPMHQQYVGTVVVTDSGLPSLSSSAQVQIDIQAVSPSSVEFTSNNYTFSVYEVVPMGTVIGKVSAVSNSSQPIVYKLLDNTNDFVIDRNNGLIQTQRPLDRENMSSYRLTVIATFNSSDDELSKTLVHVQVLDVNDNAPVFERKSYTFLIKSDAPVGTEVGRVRATDADMGLNGQISYSLHIPGQDPFTVDRNDGTITLTRRPMHQQYVGTVVVTDSGLPSLSSSAQIQIDIQAVSPTVKFTSDNYTFSVDESEPHGTVVGRIAAVSNSGEPVMYSLTDGSGCFEINKVTGIIATQCILDREVKYVYNLMVSAFVVNSTNRNDVSRAYVTVNVNDINDNSPMFYSNRYVIARTTLIGGVVGRLRAVDADVGYNAEISYSLSDSSNGLFQIRHDELVLVGPLLRNKYNIVVMATDHGSPPRSTSMHIEIDIVGKSFRHTNLHQY